MSLFRSNPRKKLQKAYEAKLAQAQTAQRNGDIRSYSMLSEEAQKLFRDIQALENKRP